MNATTEPFHNVLLTTTAVDALGLAAGRRGDRPMGTVDILAAMIAMDVTGDWDDVQLQCSYVSHDEVSRFPDPDTGPGGEWHNVPLTRTATAALETAARIAADYDLRPLPPGALALGLVADPGTGASRALLDGAPIGHAELVALIQDAVLDARLEGLDIVASSTGTPFEERALSRARQIDGGGEPSSLALLIAAVELNEEPDLEDMLETMLLEPEDLQPLLARIAAPFDDVSAADAIERARARMDGDLDAAALVVGVALEGSPRVRELLRLRGLSADELAAQIAELRLRRSAEPPATTPVVALSVLSFLLSVATSVLLVQNVLDDGGWWKLILLIGVWWGYPQEGPVFGVVVALVLAALVTPLVGLVHAINVLADIGQADAERRTRWALTGVRLSIREQRHVTQRFLSARAGGFRMLRQALISRRRGGLQPQ